MSRKFIFSIATLLMIAVMTFAASKRFTLVLDAGHGGKDHGAPGAVSEEKNLTLKYALAFGRIVEQNCPDVRVLYTRKSDVFVPLKERAEFANRNKADLFVSVHINALEPGRIGHGYQTYTIGRSLRNGNSEGIKENLEVAKRENAVITLEKDYKQTYKGFENNSAESDIMFEVVQDKNRERSVELAKLLQRNICSATGRQDAGAHQDNLAVIRLTSMPGCLMELGFISTPDEEEYLNSDAGLQAYSQGFLNAFVAYKNKYDTHIVVPYKTATKQVPDIPNIVPDEYKQDDQEERQGATGRSNTVRERNTVNRKAVKDNNPSAPNAVDDSQAPVFKIQILASDTEIRPGSNQLKGLTGVESYREGNYYKYTYGASANYNEIYRLRKEILDKFPGAFIIAFKNRSKMNVNQAINEFKRNRNK